MLLSRTDLENRDVAKFLGPNLPMLYPLAQLPVVELASLAQARQRVSFQRLP
jgi:hypothetical protein